MMTRSALTAPPLPSTLSAVSFSLLDYDWPRPLSPDAEHALALRIQAGDADAWDTMFAANMRLVLFIARRYTIPEGLTFEDLVQWGAMGLCKAIDRYNPDRATKFSTYATFWIKQAIGRALDNMATLIRVPVHQRQRLIHRDTQLDPEPLTPADLSALQAMSPMQSFDAPVDDGDADTSLYTAYSDPAVTDPAELVITADINQTRHALIAHALAALPERTARILAWYTGWPDQEPESMASIGRRLGLSTERIRQIVQQGLTQLRQDPTLARCLTEGDAV